MPRYLLLIYGDEAGIANATPEQLKQQYDAYDAYTKDIKERGAWVAHEVVDRLFRRESGQAVASLIRVLGDFDLAEEAVQEAFTVALERWPERGIPDNPGAWITTTAKNRAIDRLRREKNLQAKTETLRVLTELETMESGTPSSIPDARL